MSQVDYLSGLDRPGTDLRMAGMNTKQGSQRDYDIALKREAGYEIVEEIFIGQVRGNVLNHV